jgi:hypothetical protein
MPDLWMLTGSGIGSEIQYCGNVSHFSFKTSSNQIFNP